MSERIVERWECRECATDYPCVVEIHATDDQLPEPLKGLGVVHFRNRPCVCKERMPNWKQC